MKRKHITFKSLIFQAYAIGELDGECGMFEDKHTDKLIPTENDSFRWDERTPIDILGAGMVYLIPSKLWGQAEFTPDRFDPLYEDRDGFMIIRYSPLERE